MFNCRYGDRTFPRYKNRPLEYCSICSIVQFVSGNRQRFRFHKPVPVKNKFYDLSDQQSFWYPKVLPSRVTTVNSNEQTRDASLREQSDSDDRRLRQQSSDASLREQPSDVRSPSTAVRHEQHSRQQPAVTATGIR